MATKTTKARKGSAATVPLYVLGQDNRLKKTRRRVAWVDVKNLPVVDIPGKAWTKARAAVKKPAKRARVKPR